MLYFRFRRLCVFRKNKARENIIEAIQNLNWKNKTLSVRVNSMETEFFRKDIERVIALNKKKLDLIMIPKISTDKDVIKIERIVNQIEKKIK